MTILFEMVEQVTETNSNWIYKIISQYKRL